jgi:transcriptional regulatory protein LEU3
LIQVFYFFNRISHLDSASMVKLYITACTVIETAEKLDEIENFTNSSTDFIQRILVLASFTILRIVNSHLADSLDYERGRKCYFANIQLHRKMSIQEGDLASRASIIMTQLWTSKNAFKQPDGSNDSLVLLCRSRLSMSVVFDCFWRWRREFAGQPAPYNESNVPESMYNLYFVTLDCS